MSDKPKTLEPRYVVIKMKDLDAKQEKALMACIQHMKIREREAVVIEPHHPGYGNAVDAVLHGRRCKQGECCYCKTDEAREACFDWVKV